MPRLSPQQLAAKWQAKYGASTDAYKQGVQSVKVNPAQSAIAAKDLWIQRLNEAAANGSYEAGLANVTLAGWQQACVDKGANAIATAARLGAAKVQAAEQRIGPQRDAIVQSLPARGTLEQNKQRMLAMVDGMAALKRRG